MLLSAVTVCAKNYRATLDSYPGYEGDIDVRGHVRVESHDGLALKFSLSGLSAGVSGGIHIHTGTTCDVADEVGGHYWHEKRVKVDPWTTTYTSDALGAASGTVFVDAGLHAHDVYNHAVVVHDEDGTRVACGLIEMSTGLDVYPDYAGGLDVSGMAKTSDVVGLDLDYNLRTSETMVSGGLHIHTGTTCDDAALVGGHYWDAADIADDPWSTFYESGSKGRSKDHFHVYAGLDLEDVKGHAVVLHASDGARIACGVLKGKGSSAVAHLRPYPDYEGDLSGVGRVTVREATMLKMDYTLSGLESSISGGIHIHTGQSCEVADEVGGHYYHKHVKVDPWSTTYTSDAAGTSTGTLYVYAGLDTMDVYHHAVVVHDAASDRIACGVLMMNVDTYAAYPDYGGGLAVSGSSDVWEDETLHVEYDLRRMETDTTGGVHIHTGVSCADAAEVGGHYWDAAAITADPWDASTNWISNWKGKAKDEYEVYAGLVLEDTKGHVVVAHAADGTRIACGVLKRSSSDGLKDLLWGLGGY